MADIAKPWPLKFELESDYSNFKYWKSCVESYLEGEGLVEITCGSGSEVDDDTVREDKAKKWRAKRGKALYILKTTINKDLHRYIEHAKTPRDAWCILNSLKLYKFQLHKFPIGGDRKYREHGLIAERAKEVYEAAEQGKFETLEDIVMDYPITASGKNGLHVVAEFGHIDAMHKLLDRASAESLSSIDNQGNTILHKAAIAGKRAMVHAILSKNSSLVTARNHMGETPLFLAALHGHEDVFACLATQVDQQSERGECCLRRNDGATILHVAVNGEFYGLALKIHERYKKLAFARDEVGFTPVHIIANSPNSFQSGTTYSSSNIGMSPSSLMDIIAVTIYSCMPLLDLLLQGKEKRKEDSSGDVEALCGGDDQLTSSRSVQSSSSTSVRIIFGFCGIKHIYQTWLKHKLVNQLVKNMLITESKYGYQDDGQTPQMRNNSLIPHDIDEMQTYGTPTYLIMAVRKDIVELVQEILNVYPEDIDFLDEDGKNIMHLAIENRGEKVFKFLREKQKEKCKSELSFCIDKHGNSLLHIAAKLQNCSSDGKCAARKIRYSVQLMQWELLWFKRVKHLCPPHIVAYKDANGATAGEIFAVTHRPLISEAEDWLKKTAKSCMVVATLFATGLFGALLTVPGGYIQKGVSDNGTDALSLAPDVRHRDFTLALNTSNLTIPTAGTPVLLHVYPFKIFLFFLALALVCTCLALGFFTSILISRYEVEDFYWMLPMKFYAAITALYLTAICSITSFTLAYSIVCVDIFPHYFSTWITISYVVAVVATIEVFIDLIIATGRYLVTMLLEEWYNLWTVHGEEVPNREKVAISGAGAGAGAWGWGWAQWRRLQLRGWAQWRTCTV